MTAQINKTYYDKDMTRFPMLLIPALLSAPALAGSPEIVDVQVSKMGMNWRVDVTLEHPDSGWDHYADGWDVLDAEGNLLGHRKLLHPHVDEQPFTRSLNNLMFPDGTREVYVRARCSAEGWAGETVRVELSP